MSKSIETIDFEGDLYRIVSRGNNSGARETFRPMTKWVLERQTATGFWEPDGGHIFLPNDATYADAKKRFGF